MEINFSEKIALCYTVSGPTYKKSALEKLKTRIKHENLQYIIITDSKEYFSDIMDDDVCIKEMREIHAEYPEIVPYEYFLSIDDLKEYGDTILKTNYAFPFSAMRFHVKIAADMGITNVSLLSPDAELQFHYLSDELLSRKNIIYNAVSLWYTSQYEMEKLDYIETVIKDLWNIPINRHFMVYDEAARLYVFESIEFMNKFFSMWHELIGKMYTTDTIRHFRGTIAHNDELILATLYDILKITHIEPFLGIFVVNHRPDLERPWTVGASHWS